MNKITKKVILLLISLAVLLSLIFYAKKINPTTAKVTIVEKFYRDPSSSEIQGIRTKKQLSTLKDNVICAIEFSNQKTFIVDCEMYLDYKIGETVNIQFDGDKLHRISRKK
jgi:hypothetical protein